MFYNLKGTQGDLVLCQREHSKMGLAYLPLFNIKTKGIQ